MNHLVYKGGVLQIIEICIIPLHSILQGLILATPIRVYKVEHAEGRSGTRRSKDMTRNFTSTGVSAPIHTMAHTVISVSTFAYNPNKIRFGYFFKKNINLFYQSPSKRKFLTFVD